MEYSPDGPLCNPWGYVFQHRLVAEHWIGRFLTSKEVVHHEDRDRRNNHPSNLWLFPDASSHMRHHKSQESLRYNPEFVESLRPFAADPKATLKDAARALGVNPATVAATARANKLPWKSACIRELDEEQVRAALRGRTTEQAATLLGVSHGTLRGRFPHLLTIRARPGSLDAHIEEIRNLATRERGEEIAKRYGVNPATVKSSIRRWALSEPDAWSDVLAFQRTRRGIRWSMRRSVSLPSPKLPSPPEPPRESSPSRRSGYPQSVDRSHLP
jgi:transposase-like protein